MANKTGKPGKMEVFSTEADGNFTTAKTASCKLYERLCLPFDGSISIKLKRF